MTFNKKKLSELQNKLLNLFFRKLEFASVD